MLLLCFSSTKSTSLYFQAEDEDETDDVEGEDSDAETKENKDGEDEEEVHVGFLSSDIVPNQRHLFVTILISFAFFTFAGWAVMRKHSCQQLGMERSILAPSASNFFSPHNS